SPTAARCGRRRPRRAGPGRAARTPGSGRPGGVLPAVACVHGSGARGTLTSPARRLTAKARRAQRKTKEREKEERNQDEQTEGSVAPLSYIFRCRPPRSLRLRG